MKSTFNICFYAKKDKQKANGAYPLFARITVDGKSSVSCPLKPSDSAPLKHSTMPP